MIDGFADISLRQLALIAGIALIASLIGGVAGYGTGALMPLVLVPIVGPEPVVPIISMSALFTNTGRAFAFRHLIDWRERADRRSSARCRPARSAPGATRCSPARAR